VSTASLDVTADTCYAQATDNQGATGAAASTTLTVLSACNLDVDGNGTADALSDGILILRYLFDPEGAWNVNDALGSGATRTTRDQIKAYLNAGRTTVLDADGNGSADALSDGILILRYLFDSSGAWNVADAVGSGAARTARVDIKAYLDGFNPAVGQTSPAMAAAAGKTSVQEEVAAPADEFSVQVEMAVQAGDPLVQVEMAADGNETLDTLGIVSALAVATAPHPNLLPPAAREVVAQPEGRPVLDRHALDLILACSRLPWAGSDALQDDDEQPTDEAGWDWFDAPLAERQLGEIGLRLRTL
jgi:hypothetical protein